MRSSGSPIWRQRRSITLARPTKPSGAVRARACTNTRVSGYTVEEVEQRGGWPTLIHPDDLPRTRSRTPHLLAGEREIRETRIVTKSGETRWVRYSTHPLWDREHKRVIRLLGATQDIS